MKKTALFLVTFFMGIAFSLSHPIQARAAEKTGFLVIAPDRGYLGNELIRSVFLEFQAQYPISTLTFMGAGARSEIGEQREPLQRSLSELKTLGVGKIVVIPLFVSSHNAIFHKAQSLMKEFEDITAGIQVRTTPTMAESHLTAQILLDMAKRLSEHPELEQLIVLGSGATNDQEAEGIQRDLEKLIDYVNKRMPFKETRSLVLFSRADETLRKESMNEFNGVVGRAAARKGRTLVIPFFIDEWRATGMMSDWPRIKRGLANLNVAYSNEEMMPHPNILLWLRKMAAQNLEVTKDEIGIVVQQHGSVWFVNEQLRQLIKPLREQYKVEMAWGMANPMMIQAAISKLDRQGVKKIALLRLTEISSQYRDKVEYILGLRDTPSVFRGMRPAKVRSSAVFVTYGGFDSHPLIAEILLENTMEVSRDPASETVILLAHGTDNETMNDFWEDQLSSLAEQVQAKAKVKFLAVKYATLREDWPVKKMRALAKIKEMIREGNRTGEVLVIPARTTGAAHYREELKGLKFTLQEKGTLTNPKITLWMEAKIEEALQEFRSRVQRVPTSN